MRIGREAAAADFLAVVREVLFRQPAFEERACVHAGCRVRLEEHEVAAAAFIGAEEMIEPGLEDLGGRRVASDVAAQLTVGYVGAHHHGERVPAHDRRQAFLDREVAGIGAFLLRGNGVAIRGVGRHVGDDAALLRLLLEQAQQRKRAVVPGHLHDGFERFEPFARLVGVGVDAGVARCAQQVRGVRGCRVHGQVNSLKNSRISCASAAGCSSAAKCPPFGITVKRRMSVNTRCAAARGGRRISRGNSQ